MEKIEWEQRAIDYCYNFTDFDDFLNKNKEDTFNIISKKDIFINKVKEYQYNSGKTLQGNYWNGDYNSPVGATSSSHRSMFSIGGLIIKERSYNCSPDGSYGSDTVESGYKLEKEIILDDYNKTEINKYGQGSNDIQKVLNLKDIFYINERRWNRNSKNIENNYLTSIFTTDKKLTNYLDGNIEEIKNNPGKYLHTYNVPKGYEYLVADTFEESLFNVSDKIEENKNNIVNWRGKTFNIDIDTSNPYYKPNISFVEGSNDYNIKIGKNIPDGSYNIYLGGTPVILFLKTGEDISISISASSRWNNSQDWHYDEHRTHNVKKGYFTINGTDGFQLLKEKGILTEEEAKQNRIDTFNTYSKIVKTIYGEKVLDVIKNKKGNILSFLKELSDRKTLVNLDILEVVDTIYELKNFEENLLLIDTCDYAKVLKINKNCNSLKYIDSILPGVEFRGTFDEIMNSFNYFVNLGNENIDLLSNFKGDHFSNIGTINSK